MKNILSVAACLVFLVIVIGLLPVHGEEEIYDSVVRLHVLANSNSEEDQALKLEVRDAVLERSATILDGCESRGEAIVRIEENIGELTDAAARRIGELGYEYGVRVELGEETYPTRNYESCCFPAGEYLSLRVLIGDAEGQNWWCVLFPPMCLSAATARADAEDAFVAVGLSGEQYKIITETDNAKYEVRFKILEALEGARRK